MERLTSLAYAPVETRRLLRQRLPAALPGARYLSVPETEGVIDDADYLAFMLGLQIDFDNEVGTAKAAYDGAVAKPAGELTFEEVTGEGWVRIVWGRVSADMEVAKRAKDDARPGLAALMAQRHGRRYVVSDNVRSRPNVAALVEASERAGRLPADIGCLTPSWVAARLWEGRDHAAPSVVALRKWADLWTAMRQPDVVPARDWRQSDAKVFRAAALDVLEFGAGLPDWDQARERVVRETTIISGMSRAEAEARLPLVPPTLVDRVAWFDHPLLERSLTEVHLGSADVAGLLRALLRDVEDAELSPVPNRLAEVLVPIVAQRPDLMFGLVHRARNHSLLLVDLLFLPETSALACLFVAQSEPVLGAWERGLVARDARLGKASAFADASAVLCHLLAKGSVPPEEVAALLEWLHSDPRGHDQAGVGSPSSLATALESDLARQQPDVLEGIVQAFLARLRTAKAGSSALTATLASIDVASAADALDAGSVVKAYLREIDDPPWTSSSRRMSRTAAATLARLAARLPPEEAQRFLHPIDVRQRLANAVDENPYIVADTIARALRMHVSILSRAIAGLNGAAPAELVAALASALRTGALTHREKGRVSIFSPRLEGAGMRGVDEKSLATDIGGALAALGPDDRKIVMAALVETDEPSILAELALVVPPELRKVLEGRANALTPETAGDIHSLPEAQARIDKLLTAGMPVAAEQFMEAEVVLKTFGTPPGREVARLQARLRLALLKEDWVGIASIEAPGDLSPPDAQRAAATIAFHRAVAELRKPNGDVAAAAATFGRLAAKRPDVLTYAVNHVAARVDMLMRGDSFAVLTGSELDVGRAILSEAERLANRVQDKRDADILTCNRAVLELATGRPDTALASLATVTAEGLGERRAAFSALALHRSGRIAEAKATLAAAKNGFGAASLVEAVERHLKTGAGFMSAAPTSLDEDSSMRVRLAMADFLRMDPDLQARALGGDLGSLEALIIGHVRDAGASVVGMTPVLRTITETAKEDDVTAFVQHLLTARVAHLGWHVSDQSRGGVTAKGNLGERDLVICKGASTLAVVEAVVIDRPAHTAWSTDELTSHFQKLLAYSTCKLFFHLTYSRIANPGALLKVLDERMRTHGPAGFQFERADKIPFTDSRPIGRIARYRGEFGEVSVVFLILDLGQHIQKGAAVAAEKSQARRPRATTGETEPKKSKAKTTESRTGIPDA